MCAAPEPDSWKKKRSREIKASASGRRWTKSQFSLCPYPNFFFLYSPIHRLWPLSSWNLKFCNSQEPFHNQAKYCRAAGALG